MGLLLLFLRVALEEFLDGGYDFVAVLLEEVILVLLDDGDDGVELAELLFLSVLAKPIDDAAVPPLLLQHYVGTSLAVYVVAILLLIYSAQIGEGLDLCPLNVAAYYLLRVRLLQRFGERLLAPASHQAYAPVRED